MEQTIGFADRTRKVAKRRARSGCLATCQSAGLLRRIGGAGRGAWFVRMLSVKPLDAREGFVTVSEKVFQRQTETLC